MKKIPKIIQVDAYTDDDGVPVCGDCFMPPPCDFYLDEEITPDTTANRPGPDCPIWRKQDDTGAEDGQP